jgi:hypothetical protein
VIGIGFDQLPEKIRKSELLSPHELGELAAVPELPSTDEVKKKQHDAAVKEILHRFAGNEDKLWEMLQKYAKQLIAEGEVTEAWKVLLQEP